MYWCASLTEPENPVHLFDADRWDPGQGQRPEASIVHTNPSLRQWLWTWADGGDVRTPILAR